MSNTKVLEWSNQMSEKIEEIFEDTTPFISVMILNYSYGDLLGKALEACASQTFRDFEVVMINNGAIDDTEKIYQNFCEKHPELKTTYVFIEQNQGSTHGWNEGLKRARGEYVMFNDADDWMEPDCLERLAKKARETGADRVMGHLQYVVSDGHIVKKHKYKDYRSIPYGCLQGVIFRHSLILENEIYFPEDNITPLAYDCWYVCRFAMFQKTIGAIVNYYIYNYYIKPVSMFVREVKDNDEELFDARMRAFIECAAETIKVTNDETIRQEIGYLVIKVAYSRILYHMRFLPGKDAKRFRDRTHAILQEILPNWNKNHLLWPFGNGYDLFESIGIYALVQMDRFHMTWMIQLAGKISLLFKWRP